MNNSILIEIVYATENEQFLIKQVVNQTANIREALLSSGILEKFELELTDIKVGIFGKLKQLDHILVAGDRIEIYRPLKIDPKESRRTKAKVRQKLKNLDSSSFKTD